MQCWLCDGAHLFRQCQELVQMKSVCAQRPQVKKHFRQLLLERNAPALKVLVDAPDFFDDESDDISTLSEHIPDPEDDTIVHVNSINALPHNTFTQFDNGQTTRRDVTNFTLLEYARQIVVDDDSSDQHQDFHILCVDEDVNLASDVDTISIDDPLNADELIDKHHGVHGVPVWRHYIIIQPFQIHHFPHTVNLIVFKRFDTCLIHRN